MVQFKHLFSTLILAFSLLFLACNGDDDDSVDDDDSADDDDTYDETPPCAGETWGLITDPENAIHVRADGSDDGDGSMRLPLASLQAALELSREREQYKYIAVGPGTFVTNIAVRQDAGEDMTDDGLVIEGCGVDGTILAGGTGEHELDSIILVSEAQDVRLAGFSTEGGRRALWFWAGATVELDQADVRNSVRLGIIIGGRDSIVTLTDVSVHDTVEEIDEFGVEYGYGISIQDATTELTDVQVTGSHKAGILVDWGEATFNDVSVDGTVADYQGYLGRGIQAQNYARVTMNGGEIGGGAANRDAGFFAQATLYLDLNGVAVHGTTAGNLLEESCTGDDCPGEGIVVTQGGLGEDPAGYLAFMTDNTVTGCDRAGILIDSVKTDLSGNVAGADNGFNDAGNSIFVQGDIVDGFGDSILTGDQDPPPAELAEPRTLYLEVVETDDLLD